MTRDPRDKGCKCGVCGRRYKIDILLPNQSLWETINPEGIELLCGNCIINAIEAQGEFGAYTLTRLHEIDE